jgi:hypothetical protein
LYNFNFIILYIYTFKYFNKMAESESPVIVGTPIDEPGALVLPMESPSAPEPKKEEPKKEEPKQPEAPPKPVAITKKPSMVDMFSDRDFLLKRLLPAAVAILLVLIVFLMFFTSENYRPGDPRFPRPPPPGLPFFPNAFKRVVIF